MNGKISTLLTHSCFLSFEVILPTSPRVGNPYTCFCCHCNTTVCSHCVSQQPSRKIPLTPAKQRGHCYGRVLQHNFHNFPQLTLLPGLSMQGSMQVTYHAWRFRTHHELVNLQTHTGLVCLASIVCLAFFPGGPHFDHKQSCHTLQVQLGGTFLGIAVQSQSRPF